MNTDHIPLDVIRRANDRTRRVAHILRDTAEPQNLSAPEPPIPSPIPGMIICALAGFGVGMALTAFLLP